MAKKMKTPMMRTTVYLPVKVHRAMKIMAAQNGIAMADLLREALVQAYKDDMADIRAADESMAQYRKHPETAGSAREYFAKRLELESRSRKEGEATARRSTRA